MRTLTFGVCIVALLLLTAPTQAAQSGPAGATITGRVVDADTQMPIAGARVMLLPVFSGRPAVPLGPPPQAVTGDDGVYVFSAIAAGQYRVQVQKVGFVPPNPGDMPPFVVAAGQSGSAAVLLLRKGAAITGRVLDVRGQGLSDVTVTAVRPPPPGSGRGRGAPPMGPTGQPGQTNDIGEFRISGLAAGDYYVAASPRPTSPFGQSSTSGGNTPITTFYPGSREMAGAQVITVAAGQTVGNLEFIMMSARGFAVSGVVVDETGRPVGNGMVMLMPTAPAVLGPPRGSRTQPDGTFTIGNVAPGAYRLTAFRCW